MSRQPIRIITPILCMAHFLGLFAFYMMTRNQEYRASNSFLGDVMLILGLNFLIFILLPMLAPAFRLTTYSLYQETPSKREALSYAALWIGAWVGVGIILQVAKG